MRSDNETDVSTVPSRAFTKGVTQDELAKNAGVARATVVDFERNFRLPMAQNLIAIAACLRAAGVEFIEEEPGTGLGEGVRFRQHQVQYSSNIRVADDAIHMRMVYEGQDLQCVVPRDVLEDFDKTRFKVSWTIGLPLRSSCRSSLRRPNGRYGQAGQ